MTQWGYEDNEHGNQGDNTELSGPKALRDAYDAMKKQNDELNQKLTSFLEEQAQQKMATVFESLGVPGAQAVYQGPNDPQKAKEWVETMRQTFGGTSQGNGPGGQQEQQQEAPTLPPSMQAQYERMTQAGQEGQPLGNFEAAHAAVNDATDLNGLIQAFQNGTRTN